METKRTLVFSDPRMTLGSRALRIERLAGGLCSLFLSAGLAAVVAVLYFGQWLYLTLGLLAAGALFALSVWQIALFPALRKFPYSLIVTPVELILREKNLYHYIRYADLGKLMVNCPHYAYEYSGNGCERLDFIDGEIYYYIGEIKKRFATREAEQIARLVAGFTQPKETQP